MKTKRVLIATGLAIFLSLGVIACSRVGNSDPQIIGEVVMRIHADPQVSNKQISVLSSNGVVTLTGSTATDAERAAIASDAAQVAGVKTVVNNLVVGAPAADIAGLQATQQAAAAAQPAPVEYAAPVRARRPAAYSSNYPQRRLASSIPPEVSLPAAYSAPAQVATAAPVASIPAPPPAPTPLTIEAGTTISVRMIDSINSGHNHAGDMFHGTVDAPVTVGDTIVIPEGADVTGRVAEVKDAGHFAGQPALALELTNLSVNGRKYSIRTDQYRQQGKSRGASTAKTVGSGAAIGAIIGGIAGGGRGAAIGAAAGGGLGGGVQASRKAEEVHIASEALISFRLENSLTMMPAVAARQTQRYRMDDSASSLPPPPRDNAMSLPPPPRDVPPYNDSTSTSDQDNSDRPVLKRRPTTPPNQ